MSDRTNYCTGKGLLMSVIIIAVLMIVTPIAVSYAVIGPDAYARQCKLTPALPCFGLSE